MIGLRHKSIGQSHRLDELAGTFRGRASRRLVAALAFFTTAWVFCQPSFAHLGRRLRIDVVDGKLVAKGVNTGMPDGAPEIRPFDSVVHDHWRNFDVPSLPNPLFANSFLPEFDVPDTVTSLQDHSLNLRLVDAFQWVHPQLAHHGSTTPVFQPLDPGEVIRIEGAANTSTTTEAMGSLLLIESVPVGGDPDIGILYSIDGHPYDELHVLKFILSAANNAGPTVVAPSDPIYVVLAPDGATPEEKLHHAALFLSEHLGTALVPEPSALRLLVLGLLGAFGRWRRNRYRAAFPTIDRPIIQLTTC